MSNDVLAPMDSSDSPLYLVRHARKTVESPAGELTILRDVSFEVKAGEALAIVGSSGSGKSTLLHILGTLDRASGGTVLFEGRDLSALSAQEAAHFRNRELGFVFQFHHLLPEFTTVSVPPTTKPRSSRCFLVSALPPTFLMARASSRLCRTAWTR